MDKLQEIYFKEKKAIFDRLEKIASQANLSKEERAQYEREWKIYNDYYNVMESAEKKARMEQEEARAKGLAEGLEQGREEQNLLVARKMKAKGLSANDIADITGLSIEEIEKL